MESILLTIDILGLVAVLVMVVKNERRRPGEAQIGPFRYIETRLKKKATSRWNTPR